MLKLFTDVSLNKMAHTVIRWWLNGEMNGITYFERH